MSQVTSARRDDAGGDARESETVLRVEELTKTYGDGADAVRAVDGVSFSVARGEVVGVLGPNGAGKTTTIKSILGLVVPTSGTVEVAGVDATKRPRAAYRHVGATLEGARNVYWKLTVRENLDFFAALGGHAPRSRRERHEELLERFGLAAKADEPVNDLSRGQKQKVSLACTLARGTDVVFLDEPTLGLDVEASLELRRELRRLAAEEDVTVVLSSHDMDVVEAVCDRVVILSDGRVIADDSVEALVDVFETQAYQLRVEGSLPAELRHTFETEYGAENWSRAGDRLRFDVTLPEGDALYDLLERLRAAGVSLAGVDARTPDLEDVFLQVTDRAGETATVPETADPDREVSDS
jgi:ABC-2 type transport system ATP-binding protein